MKKFTHASATKFGILSASFLLAAVTPVTGSVAEIPTSFSGNNWSADIIGRIQVDFSDIEGDRSTLEENRGELRRLRLGTKGTLGERIGFKIELNTDSSEDVTLADAYLEWKLEDGQTKLRVGQFKTPNSLDEQTSSRFISTIERSAFTDAFGFDRRVGAGVFWAGANSTVSAGLFTNNIEADSSSRGYALAARGTMAMPVSDSVLFHGGLSFRYRDQRDNAADLRYRQRPYSHLPGRIISTGFIAESDFFTGAEAALISERFWLAGEYGRTDTSCSFCADDPVLQGGYLEAGLFFRGSRTYKGGKFDRPQVYSPVTKGGSGAFSFVARFDTLDLDDGSIDGGELDTFVLGADWWPTRHTRVSINYFQSDADLGNITSGLDGRIRPLIAAGVEDETVDGFMLRLQADL